jgi:hypothetical protein
MTQAEAIALVNLAKQAPDGISRDKLKLLVLFDIIDNVVKGYAVNDKDLLIIALSLRDV